MGKSAGEEIRDPMVPEYQRALRTGRIRQMKKTRVDDEAVMGQGMKGRRS